MGDADDTVILRPARAARPGRGGMVIAAVVAAAVAGGAGAAAWLWRGRAGAERVAAPAALQAPQAPIPQAQAPIGVASEQEILDEVAGEPILRRFAAKPAILVLDFPSLGWQGRMLNRVAAWAEKSGVPHDRLLSDAELAAAIRASGTTADTYYYGHDYSGPEIARFFALADRDRLALLPEEEALRGMMARASAEPAGFGALITLPRAGEGGITADTRLTILRHELSHGEFFTNPAYAAFVATVWNGVLTGDERAAFRTYLAGEGYDPALEEVMMNEMQAYLMFTPDPVYFDPTKLGIAPGRLAQIRAGFAGAMPAGWLKEMLPRQWPG